jgi:hypothetical protein
MNEIKKFSSHAFPITFNPHKHHLGFLKMKIKEWRKKERNEAEQDIRYIGNNLIDLYFGKLTVDEICNEVYNFAKETYLTSPANLAQWLKPMDYKKTELTDTSLWVIKQGEDASRYLHIHPAKYSPFTVRVKAPTLKTVIALQVFDIDLTRCDIETVNSIRVEKLNLSPVKGLVTGKGIARLMANFNSM